MKHLITFKIFEEFTYYKSGGNSTILHDIDNPTKLKKVFMDLNSYDAKMTLEYFPKHPELFPTVYEVGSNYIILEKLNSDEAEKEYVYLNNWFNKNYNTKKNYLRNYLLRNFRKLLNNPVEIDISSMSDSDRKILDRYDDLVSKIMNILGDSFLLDIHKGNFGYTNQGILKMLDI